FGGKNNAFAYLLFVLIYMPCVAVIATIHKEAGGKWAMFSVFYLTFLAWIVATIFYQISIIAVQPTISIIWVIICLAASIGFFSALKYRFRRV
ncbi:MAG TPA: nucleoside recognition domain-containing protein, partial [Candidatus Cloacimonadota bacterium]|nr:nucleoside recognition domain-containing protein [Candidatus Cloacimonadota bacterium]